MREHIGLGVLVNWVCMLRAGVDGAICLADDEEEGRFYQRCKHDKAEVLFAFGMAIELLDILEGRGLEGVVAAVNGKHALPLRQCVFRPALGDVASLLLASRSFDRVIQDVGGDSWLKACEKAVGPLLHQAVWIARLLGKIRAPWIEAKAEPPSAAFLAEEMIDWITFEISWGKVTSLCENAGYSAALLGVFIGQTWLRARSA